MTRVKTAAGALAWLLLGSSALAATPGSDDEEIPLASAHAAAVETPSAPGAWGGPRTGHEATLSDRVVKYDIDATLDPRMHTIDARQKLTWRNRSDRNVKS